MESNVAVSIKKEVVPFKSRVWVSAADGSIALLQSVVGGGALTYYFTRVMGLNPQLAGLVWILFGIWNAVNDPLFGYISDSTKSNLGRRIPYIRYGAPIISLAFISFWVAIPALSTQTGLFIQLLFCLFVYDMLYTAIATAIYIMPYEMAISNQARSTIFIWKIIFMAISTAVPLIVLPIIQPGPEDDPTGFRWIMAGLALVAGAVTFFSTFFYKENKFTQDEKQPPLIKSILETFRNRAFLIFEVVSFTIMYVQAGLMQGVLYYFDELKVPGLPMYIGLFMGILSGIFLFIRQRHRWGVKRTVIIWCAIFAAGCLAMLLLGRNLIPAVISFFLIGIGFAGGMYLVPLMNGDVIDFDEHRTGLRREGMYAGVNSLITKPAISLSQAAFLSILSWFGYDQNLGKGLQTAAAQDGILIAWMLVPFILLSICVLTMRWYPLAGEKWDQIKQLLATLHAKKEEEHLRQHGFSVPVEEARLSEM